MNIQELHLKNVRLFSDYRNLEGQLIEALQEFDSCQGFLKMGYASLYSYCVENLGMSEGQAYTIIRVSRKAKEVPKLKEAVIKQEITLSSAKVIASVITDQNKDVWIEKAKALSKYALEKEIVKINPRAIKPDKFTSLTSHLSEVRMVLSEEAKQILARVKELESKRMKAKCDLNAAIVAMGKLYLDKKDPVHGARRSLRKASSNSSQVIRRKIPAPILRQVNLRDKGECQATHQEKTSNFVFGPSPGDP